MTTGNHTYAKTLNSYRSYVLASGQSFSPSVYGSLHFTCGRSWSGTNDSAYRLKIEQGKSATNAYTVNITKVLSAVDANARMLSQLPGNSGYQEYTHSTYGQDGPVTNWSSTIIANNTNACMSRLYQKLNKMENAVGGLEFLAEFRETVKMVKHPAEALATYLNRHASKLVEAQSKSKHRREAILRSKRSKRSIIRQLNREQKDLSKTIAASWLELQFGVKPLLGVLSDAAAASLEVFPQKGAVKLITCRERTQNTVVTRSVIALGNIEYIEEQTDLYEYTVTLKARVRYSGKYDGMSNLELLKEKSGFRLSQVVPTLWELTPLSVFTDYFVNVGDILSAAMTETKDVFSVDRYVNRQLLRRTKLIIVPKMYFTIDPSTYREGLVVSTKKQYTREAYYMVIPTLKFTTPVDSFNKMLNLSAFVRLALFH